MSKRIYRLGPDVVSTEMLTLAKNFVRGDLEEYLPLAQATGKGPLTWNTGQMGSVRQKTKEGILVARAPQSFMSLLKLRTTAYEFSAKLTETSTDSTLPVPWSPCMTTSERQSFVGERGRIV